MTTELTPSTSPSIPPGTELAGRYRIIRMLGEGGMGAVFEAEHTIIGRRVAVKVLHPKFCVQHEAVVRFTREARAAAAIGHENIVDVTDFGTHDGQPFLVMELLRGTTLDELMVDRDQFELARAVDIVGHVLSALASAHAAGIVHRDLKPENIFLAEMGARTVVKILDFGISKFQVQSDDLLTTEEGAMLGTPTYMSPEQWLSERDIDHRADLFAVGVLFYELLTGQLPYDGASRGDLMLRVVTGADPPTAPSTLAEGLPPELDAIVLRGVARDRAGRFQTAQEFLDALRPWGAQHIEVTPSLPGHALAAVDTFTGQLRVPPVRRLDARDMATLDEPAPSTEASIVRPLPVRRVALVAGVFTTVVALGFATAWALRPRVDAPAPRPAAQLPADAATPPRPTTVRIELRGAPAGAMASVDGAAPVPATELRLARDANEHRLVVTHQDVRREFTVRGDTDQVLVVDLTPPPTPAAPVDARQGRHRRDGPPDENRGERRRGPRRRQRGLDINRTF